jgi:hypothetical protein
LQHSAASQVAANPVVSSTNQQAQEDMIQASSTPSVPSQPAQFNLVSRSGNNILVESLAAQFEKPMKAYVVSGEVISGTELDRRRIRTATFG